MPRRRSLRTGVTASPDDSEPGRPSGSGQRDLCQFLPGFWPNYTRWDQNEYYALHDQLSITHDRDERVDMMFRLQEILMEECPAVWPYKQVDIHGVTANLEWGGTADELISVAEAPIV